MSFSPIRLRFDLRLSICDSPESEAQGNILNNFGPDDLLINIARFCFGANMSTTSKY